MATYKIKFLFTNGSELIAFPEGWPEDIYDAAEKLIDPRYQCFENPNGTADLVFMNNVCHAKLEKWEG